MQVLKLFLFLSLGMMTTSCMVGPDFHSPSAPQVNAYTKSPLPLKTAGKAQFFIAGETIPAAWWYLFRSPALNALIEQGIANSPNLASAMAALKQSQEIANTQIGNAYFPAVDGGFSGSRQRAGSSNANAGNTHSIFNLVNASVNVSYTLDIFGGARRQTEALMAQVDYQQFQLIAAYLTLTSNIVTTAVTAASLQEQIRATKGIIASQEKQLAMMNKQFELGGLSRENTLAQEALLEASRASLPPLEKSLSQSRHRLSVLVGDFPNKPLPVIYLSVLNLPAILPVSLPSNLVRQRPDIRASEALLHAASANVGVKTANLLPQITLTGTYGFESTSLSTLFNSSNKIWSMAGALTQPLFHGGALLADRRAAVAAFNQAAGEYRETVLQAFQNVADTLRALETDARTLQAQKKAEWASRRQLTLLQKQYRLGGVSSFDLLVAQQQYQQIQINRIQAEAARYTDTAALFQALGGGWWNCKKLK